MKVRMKSDVSGTREGQPWPARGEVTDLPKEEALELCRNGMAEPVDARGDDVERATVRDDSEKRNALTTKTASATVPGGGQEDAEASSSTATRAPARKTAATKPASEK